MALVPDESLPDGMAVFDRALLRRRRTRAAKGFAAHDFLHREVAERLAERLEEVKRTFPLALDLGCHNGALAERLAARPGTAQVIRADLSPAFATQAGEPALAADEEALPFRDGAFDLVSSALVLHWVNDLPGALIQIRRALKPDGFFIGAMLGGQTLHELRRCLMEAEMEQTGGVSPRLSPFADLRDGAALLQRAGFALPVADHDVITVTYANALALMQDLRGMGATNAVLARSKRPLTRKVLMDAAARYANIFGEADGRIPATFEIIYLTGWAPHESQPQPLRRGSGKVWLGEALGTTKAYTPP